MSSAARSRSPSLEPPHKTVELEDRGAHSLEGSSEDEFSDAREGLASPTRPVTRVERVDTRPAHGEVPGTKAYNLRTEDAKPDEIAVQSDSQSKQPTDAENTSTAPATLDTDLAGPKTPQSPIPKTVVTRVDSIPAHGEVPGSKAAAMRSADAEPDVLETRGDVPSKSQDRLAAKRQPVRDRSPIAADGGFGPMEDSEDDDVDETRQAGKSSSRDTNQEIVSEEDGGYGDSGFGDDFDDFAEGEEADDFGDFDDGFREADEPEPTPAAQESIPAPKSLFPIPEFSGSPSLSEIQDLIQPHLAALFPSLDSVQANEPPPPLPEGNSAFLDGRSYELWRQLVEPPPLQPPNWVRSRIRRLFLVSLGVPVDLDEILPKSKQKKLVLQYNPAEQSAKVGAKSKDGKPSQTKEQPKRTRGPPPPPEFNVDEVKKLCALSDADLDEMSDEVLRLHVKELERLSKRGKEVLQYWVKRKEMAVDEKEAFDSVVESLVRHARRVRN